MHFVLAYIVISVIIEFYLFQNPYTLFYCEQWKAENIIFIDEGVSNSYYWWLRKLQRYNRTWWAFPLLQASLPCLRWSISRDFFQNAFLYEFVFCVLFVSQFFFYPYCSCSHKKMTFVSLSLRSLVFAPFSQCYLQLRKRKHYFCFFSNMVWKHFLYSIMKLCFMIYRSRVRLLNGHLWLCGFVLWPILFRK